MFEYKSEKSLLKLFFDQKSIFFIKGFHNVHTYSRGHISSDPIVSETVPGYEILTLIKIWLCYKSNFSIYIHTVTDLFWHFCDSNCVLFFCHILDNLSPNLKPNSCFGIWKLENQSINLAPRIMELLNFKCPQMQIEQKVCTISNGTYG